MTDDGLLKVGAETKNHSKVATCTLNSVHLICPKARGKSAATAVCTCNRYEVQILESFALEGIENECGAIYLQRRPDLNMALPPLVWQTYDIFFVPAQFSEDGKKTRNTELTVIHNGVPVQYHTSVAKKTGAGQPEGKEPLTLLLQDHSDPVVFRNVWYVPPKAIPTAKTTDPLQQALTITKSTGLY